MARIDIYLQLLDVIQRRDGWRGAVEYDRQHLAPDRLPGFGLSNVAVWAALEGDWTAAEELFDAASLEQVVEHPLL